MATSLGFIHRFVPATRAGLPTLLLLHGTGGNEDDLLPLGAQLLPGAALLSPRGQVLEHGMPRFFRRLAEGVFDLDDLRVRTHELADFVDAARRTYDLGAVAAVAVGLSNGANIAAAIMLLRPGTLGGGLLLRPMVPLQPDPLPALGRTLSTDALGELAEIATRVIPGSGLAVERVGNSAHDAATPQFVSSPGYEHAWLNPDNTEVSIEDLSARPRSSCSFARLAHSAPTWPLRLPRTSGWKGDITYSTNNGLIEVVPLGISKATGIEELARPLGITAEDVVAFGDMPNDVPMLGWAGLGVAMGNAHPDAIAAADEVTASNTDDGVARVLERWWL